MQFLCFAQWHEMTLTDDIFVRRHERQCVTNDYKFPLIFLLNAYLKIVWPVLFGINYKFCLILHYLGSA